MSGCPNQKVLQRFADGELRRLGRSRIAEHINTCDLCAREIRQLRQMGQLVSAAIKKETESHDLTPLWERIRPAIAPTPSPRTMPDLLLTLLWKPAARAAYAVVIVLLAGLFILRPLFLTPDRPFLIGQARVDSVSTYSPDITVSVMVSHADKSAVVWITGLDAIEEN